MRVVILGTVVLAAAVWSGCEGVKSPTRPKTPPPPPTARYEISGNVSSVAGGGIMGALVSVQDGFNADKSTSTDERGNFTLSLPEGGHFTLRVTASGYYSTEKRVTLTHATRIAIWSCKLYPTDCWISGVGDSAVEMPTFVAKEKVTSQHRPGF